ncbi:MAG: hypothetical protein ABI949_15700 [Ilumatobacteraceae bacterium]
MRTGPASHIVELIDDDEPAGAFPASAANDNERRRSRWLRPAAMAAIVVVLGYVVGSTAIGSGRPEASSAPGRIGVQYYVADAPPGFKMYTAESSGLTGGGARPPLPTSGPAELWATAEASAASGTWFVVSRGTHHATGRNSYRTVVNGSEVIVERDPASGQSRLSFVKNGVSMEITAFGWIDRQLVRLVRAVSADDDAIHFSDNFFEADHRRVLSVDPTEALYGEASSRVGYTTGMPTDLAQSFTITVGTDGKVNQSTVMKFAITEARTFTVGAGQAIIGTSAADPLVTTAQWHDGQRLITLSGTIDPQQLKAIAATVHPASNDEVRTAMAAGAPGAAALQTQPQKVVSGMLPDGWGWSIRVSVADPDDPDAGYVWWIAQPGDSITPSETRRSAPIGKPSIDTFVEHGRTYVVAKVPRSMAGAELHVNPTGLPSTLIPFHDVDPAMADLFSADAFVEPVPFTAEILDSGGNSLSFWPQG